MATYKSNDLLKGDIRKTLIQMALPLMLFNSVSVIYSLVDSFFVGKLGELQVGAISVISNINMCGTAFVTGLSAAGISLLSKAVGAGDMKKGNQMATILLEISIIISLVIAIICVVFAHLLLRWLNVPDDIYQDSYMYLLGLSPSFIFSFILTIFQTIRQSNGDSRSAVALNIEASIINCLLDPLFIFTFKWGMFGAALATSVSKLLVCPFAMRTMLKDYGVIHVDFKRYRFSTEILKEIFILALPASMGSFLLEFGFTIMNKFILGYGSVIMSAYGIGGRVSSLFSIPTNALSSALTPFIGQSIGARNFKRTKNCFKQAFSVGLIVCAAVTVLGLMLSRPLVELFYPDISTVLAENSIEYSLYSVATTVFMLWMNYLLAGFNGAGETGSSFVINVTRLWALRIPMLYAFGKYTDFGPTGIWIAMILSNVVICIIGQIWFEILFRKKYHFSETDNMKVSLSK
ncbi:MAG: MATE family efflux transporter [Erysipelotrichaceae bacterium]|nr:MATE family efflux transporter [Erysipelotrichaceae bacterium]